MQPSQHRQKRRDPLAFNLRAGGAVRGLSGGAGTDKAAFLSIFCFFSGLRFCI